MMIVIIAANIIQSVHVKISVKAATNNMKIVNVNAQVVIKK